MVNEEKHDKKEQNGYERAIKYMGVFGGTQSFAILLGIIKTKFATKLLGASGLGIIAMYNRTLQMLSDFTNLSLSFSAVRQIAEAHKEGDAVKLQHWVKVLRSWTFLTAVVGVFLAIALSPLLGKWVFEGNDYYTSRFLLLSPVVGFMAIIGGELAILKGVQSLYKVAKYTLWTALAGLLVSVPLYFCMGIAGIFPAIFLTSFLQMAVLLYYSLPIFPYRIAPFSRHVLRDGLDMVKFGLGYIFAAIMGSGSMWLVCKILIDVGNDRVVGFYSTGYFLMNLLPGVLFAAIDSDFYPRLSASNKDIVKTNSLVNEQAEVQLLIQAPMLMAYSLALPLLVPLFYDKELLAAVPMTQLAMFGMLVRTMTYPMSYLPLSRGDSKVYMVQECIYDLLFTLFVVAGYMFAGLLGVGVAMATVLLVDWIVVYAITGYKYSFRFASGVYFCFVLQAAIFILMMVTIHIYDDGWEYWCCGILCVSFSSILSLYLLSKRLNYVGRLLNRIKRIVRW
ncbi:MAG: oligosaccharide flippase family protein [Bacteroidaceae bacterium]|nr:oligosaccharide flippase family protein [Bacteroidaceae bacterium]